MPTVLLINGFRFFFYSNENNEPTHVHVTKGDGNCKMWLEPNINIAYMHGFTSAHQNEIMRIVVTNYELLKSKWHEFFN